MNLIILKNNLREELTKYNYVFGSRLLCWHLNNLAIKYADDLYSSNLLTDFFIFLENDVEKEKVMNSFDILCNINNINIIIELLCFFNPTLYYDVKKMLC
jgi:hypothetical protein